MTDQPTSVESILCTAVEIDSPEQRATYLDEACGDDGDLRAQVEKLLRAHSRAGNFLEQPVAGDRPTEVLDALTDPEPTPDAINPPPNETLFDFLESSDVPDRLGKLGPYEVIELIGRGGMGVVFRTHDPKLNRVVAVKVLAPEFAANPTARKRFLREARAAAAVSHTHVVTIHAVEDDDKTPYLVMECIDGQTLQDKIEREGTLQLEAILRIGSQIAAGLAAAHGQGLVHRDVKPSNILLENGVERVKITDFGLARAVDDIGITRTGDVAGTPEFMSPEQAQGLAVEHRSDLFSLGSVLYAMCTGRSPFRADSAVAALRRVCDDVPRPIGEVNPEIPEELIAIIDRLLAKNPDERFQTAEEVADLLSRHLACLQHPTNRPPTSPVDVTQDLSAIVGPGDTLAPSRRGPSRRQTWSVVGLVLLAVLVGVSITEATGVTQFAATVIRILKGEGTEVVNGKSPPPAAETGTADVEPPRQEDKVPWTAILPPDAPEPAVAPFDSATAKRHQEAWADYLDVPIEREIELAEGEKLTLVLIPPGEFLMGSSEEEHARFLGEAKATGLWDAIRVPHEVPQHRVKITQPFCLGRYEFTQAQWAAVIGDNPSKIEDHANPVERVSWEETQPLLEKLNQEHAIEGMEFVLPTEAQWEYACRAGTTTPWHWGGSEDALVEFANSTGTPGPVGQLRPNPWGLYDMHGNVWEWCADWYGTDYYSVSPQNDPRGLTAATSRVNRGGSWYHRATFCRSAFRNCGEPEVRDTNLGFRLAAVFVDESSSEVGAKADAGPIAAVPSAAPPTAKAETAEVEPPHQRDEVPWAAILPADAPDPAVVPFDSATAKRHQQAWAEYLDVSIEREIDLPGGEKLTLMLIPPGEFLMGSSEEEQADLLEWAERGRNTWAKAYIPTEGPQHRVKITRPFYLGRYEVTQAQWEALMGNNPSEITDPANPVEQVNWLDIQPLLEKLNREYATEALEFTLPTEAQWEYASRAGSTTLYHFGDNPDPILEYANTTGTPAHVGQLKPNPWGLYDIHGNVWEWCADWHEDDYYLKSPSKDPRGAPTGSSRANRGGSYAGYRTYCRTAFRNHGLPTDRDPNLGFRLAAVLVSAPGK